MPLLTIPVEDLLITFAGMSQIQTKYKLVSQNHNFGKEKKGYYQWTFFLPMT